MILETFVVPDGMDGAKLYPVVKRMLPDIADFRIRQAFDKRDVKQNGKRVAKEEKATAGALIAVYLADTVQPLVQIPIVYEDERLLVVRKPVGCSCEKDAKGGLTIGERLMKSYPDKFAAEPHLCHRLDNQTDGLLLMAKDEQTQSEMIDAFREHRIRKQYQCLVKGCPREKRAVLDAFLCKDAKRACVRVFDRPREGAKPIRTGYEVLEQGELSRLQIDLYTGRTHQIRAHLAHIGCPILGDDQYGDRAFNKQHKAKRLMLTSVSLRFELQGTFSYLNSLKLQILPEF